MSNLRSARLVGIGAIAGIALSLGLSALAERGNTGRNVLPLDELRQFSEVFGTIKAYYVEPVKDNKLITDAISGMLTGLDPHSAYLDENAFKELQVNTQGEFGGLGIEIGTEDGFIKVVSPIEGTPASKAGVKAGDLIIKIGDTPTKDMRLEEAVKMMRGKPKSPITLTLQRKGVPEPIVLTIVRDIIQVQSVRSKLLEPGVGYIRISQFQEHTVNNLVNHLEQLAKQNNGPRRSSTTDLSGPLFCLASSSPWCWTCAMTRAACCTAPSASRRPSCSRAWKSPPPTAVPTTPSAASTPARRTT